LYVEGEVQKLLDPAEKVVSSLVGSPVYLALILFKGQHQNYSGKEKERQESMSNGFYFGGGSMFFTSWRTRNQVQMQSTQRVQLQCTCPHHHHRSSAFFSYLHLGDDAFVSC